MKPEPLNNNNSAKIKNYLVRFSELLIQIGETPEFRKKYEEDFSSSIQSILHHPLVKTFFTNETGADKNSFSLVQNEVQKFIKETTSDNLICSLALEIYCFSNPRIELKSKQEIDAAVKVFASVAADFQSEFLRITDFSEIETQAQIFSEQRTFDIGLYFSVDEKTEMNVTVMAHRSRYSLNDDIFEYRFMLDDIEARLLDAYFEFSESEYEPPTSYQIIKNTKTFQDEVERYINDKINFLYSYRSISNGRNSDAIDEYKKEILEKQVDYVQSLARWHKLDNILLKSLLLLKFSNSPPETTVPIVRNIRNQFAKFVKEILQKIESICGDYRLAIKDTDYGCDTTHSLSKDQENKSYTRAMAIEVHNLFTSIHPNFMFAQFCNYRLILNKLDTWLREYEQLF